MRQTQTEDLIPLRRRLNHLHMLRGQLNHPSLIIIPLFLDAIISIFSIALSCDHFECVFVFFGLRDLVVVKKILVGLALIILLLLTVWKKSSAHSSTIFLFAFDAHDLVHDLLKAIIEG